MFTGLIEAVGTVKRFTRTAAGARLEVETRWPDDATPAVGDSVAVDGVCLTVLDPSSSGFAADVSPETLKRTLVGELQVNEAVNLERALRLGDRLGGHLVQGHVDTVVRIVSIRPEGAFQTWRLDLPNAQANEVTSKGSVAVHGVSLTVAALGTDWFEVALIPATLEATNFGQKVAGARLHLETDVLAKYVARQSKEPGRSALDEVFGGGSGA
jgi:riboflavin synthase